MLPRNLAGMSAGDVVVRRGLTMSADSEVTEEPLATRGMAPMTHSERLSARMPPRGVGRRWDFGWKPWKGEPCWRRRRARRHSRARASPTCPGGPRRDQHRARDDRPDAHRPLEAVDRRPPGRPQQRRRRPGRGRRRRWRTCSDELQHGRGHRARCRRIPTSIASSSSAGRGSRRASGAVGAEETAGLLTTSQASTAATGVINAIGSGPNRPFHATFATIVERTASNSRPRRRPWPRRSAPRRRPR